MGTYLAALEKRDAAAYNVLQARQDSELAKATVEMQDLRVAESEHGIALAELQKERAEGQRNTYDEWFDEGLNECEGKLLENYRDLKIVRDVITAADAAITVGNTATMASSGGWLGNGLGAGWSLAALVSYAASARAAVSIHANEIEHMVQVNQLRASHERRRDEWSFQKSLAEKDVQIGEEQIALAKAQKGVVEKEREIADLRVEHVWPRRRKSASPR